MKTSTTLTKDKRKTIAKAQRIVDAMNAIKGKTDKMKEDTAKIDLVKMAEKVGKEMRERQEKNLKEEK